MYLDISNLFLFCLISLVVGAVIMLIVQVTYLFTPSDSLKLSFFPFLSLFQYYIFLRFFKLNSDEVDAANQDGNKNSKFNMPEVSKDRRHRNTSHLHTLTEKSKQNNLIQFSGITGRPKFPSC